LFSTFTLKEIHSMKRMQKGFTLIELMIVVAIIGILAAVAIPQYQDYTVKAKLSKVQSTLAPVKTALALYFQENGSFPGTDDSWASLGIAAPTRPDELSGLVVKATSGAIEATMDKVGPGVNGGKLTLTPTTAVGQTAMAWTPTCDAGITSTVAKNYFKC
jgi:type IV pilus assembly protein PilA